jgi:2-polyprenyl-3-methyl-5-hydroxy-6-metoxy-1,4-benzoquinol methylase
VKTSKPEHKTPQFDAFASTYASTHNKYLPPGMTNESFFVQKRDWVFEQIEERLMNRESIEVLDFGCGPAQLCRALSTNPRVTRITGVDESDEVQEQALKVMSASAVPFEIFSEVREIAVDRKFDLITAFNVFHHVPISERERVARALAEHLKPGGCLLVWEHNPWNPATRYLVKICPFDTDAILIRKSNAEKLWRPIGLRLLSSEFVNFSPPTWQKNKWVQKFEKLISDFPIGAQYRLVMLKNG